MSVPFDVIKTRVMNSSAGTYSSPLDCLVKTVKHEGVGALYKGFFPTYARLGPWQLVFFVVYEQLSLAFMGKSFGR